MSRRDISVALTEFNTTISEVLKIADMMLPDSNSKSHVESLRRKFTILKGMGPSEPLAQASPFFIRFTDKIMDRDEEFFANANIREEAAAAGKPISNGDDYVEDLIDKLRAAYKESSKAEKDTLYNYCRVMLRCSIEWKLYMDE